MDSTREMLRHTLATLAYRAAKTFRGTPDNFAAFRAAAGTRSPAELLAHIGDLLDWARAFTIGKPEWHASMPLPWPREVDRFFTALRALDDYLASGAPLGAPADKLFQGPLADALTHVGQLALLRRLAGAPIKGENYFKAGIAVGRVGADQAAPAFEFE
jgi:hypothetical protein